MSTNEFLALNAAQSVKKIAYDKAQVVGGFVSGTSFLVVSGETACVNMDVRLSPLIYITCPDYWGIEVVGSLRGGSCIIGIVPTPFTVVIPLAGITGSKGIEVLGANRSDTFEVSGGCRPAGEWEARC